MKKRVNLTTPRLLLRPFELSDAPQVQELVGDKAIADTTLNIPYPYENSMAVQWISTHKSKSEAGELINLAITLSHTQELIGSIGLISNKRFNHAELGYWRGKKYWNNGYCTEAAKAVLELAFNQLDLHKVIANHITRNSNSGKVMRKIGMTKEGLLKEHVIKWDKYEDVVSYAILKKEWIKNEESNNYWCLIRNRKRTYKKIRFSWL
jgi:RimJ/RimL family protein N-acetyltransferase